MYEGTLQQPGGLSNLWLKKCRHAAAVAGGCGGGTVPVDSRRRSRLRRKTAASAGRSLPAGHMGCRWVGNTGDWTGP